MRHRIDTSVVDDFLRLRRIAVVGASDRKENFGNTVYTELRDHGYDVVAVHPSATTVAGDQAFASLADVPGTVDGVLVMVHRDRAADVVRQCVDRGVRSVWLFQGIGPSAVSDEALALCADHGIAVVPGACPLMFLEPTGLVHRVHRGMRRLNGSLLQSA